MKRIISFILMLSLIFCLCACGANAPEAPKIIELTEENFSEYFSISSSIRNMEKHEVPTLIDTPQEYYTADYVLSCDQMVVGDLNNVSISVKFDPNENRDEDQVTYFSGRFQTSSQSVKLNIPISGHAEVILEVENNPTFYQREISIADFHKTITSVSGTITLP